MPDQAYSDLVARAADSDWINRVKGALEQVALTKIQNTPVDATAIAEDALGRFVRANLDFHAREKALDVALDHIGAVDLQPANVSDAAVFASVNALWDKWLPEHL